MEIMHRLQQGTSTGTFVGIGTCRGEGTGTGAGVQGMDYCLTVDGLVIFRDMMYILDNNELKKVISVDFHMKPNLGHPRYQKTLIVANKFYYLSNMKKDVVEFMAMCFNCQHLKAECKHPGGLLQPISIPEWEWEVISMDFITRLPRTVRQHDSIMVVVYRLTKVAHFI